jgi:hypothetical protein
LRWSIYEALKDWTEGEREKLVSRLQSHPKHREFLDYYLSLYKAEEELDTIDVDFIDKLHEQYRQRVSAEKDIPVPDLDGLFANQTDTGKPPVKLSQVSGSSAVKRFKARMANTDSFIKELESPSTETLLHNVTQIIHPKGIITLISPITVYQTGSVFSFEEQGLEYGKCKNSDRDVNGMLSDLIDGIFFQDRLDEIDQKRETRQKWLQLLGWKKQSQPKSKEYRKFVSGLMKPVEVVSIAECHIPDDILENITEQITEQEIIS